MTSSAERSFVSLGTNVLIPHYHGRLAGGEGRIELGFRHRVEVVVTHGYRIWHQKPMRQNDSCFTSGSGLS